MGYANVRHEFKDYIKPEHPLALTDQPRAIVCTEVKVLHAGSHVESDVLLFTHYVRRL